MVSSRNNLTNLRNEIKKLQRNTSNKISRIRRSTGVVVAGTGFDPRRDLSKVKTYNTKQLESFANELRAFNARGTQFVPDSHNRPLPRAEWQAYVKAESAVNSKRAKTFGPLENKLLPTGETIGQRMAKMKPDHPMMGNPAAKTEFHPTKRDPFNVKDRNALKKLTSTMKKQLTKSYDAESLKNHRREFGMMVKSFNDEQMSKDVKGLKNHQLHALWNLTKFPDAVSLMYAKIQHDLQGGKESWADSMVQDQLEDARRLIEWAKTL